MLIVGLGNPGADYTAHRHNIGFRVVEALAHAHGLAFSRCKGAKAQVAEGKIAGRAVILAKPQTFMNLSGKAVGRLRCAYELLPQSILVVYDDLDLPLGRLRLRPGGGSGGHKGMRSTIESLGTQGFPRLRLGIGRPPGRVEPAEYVLQPFAKDDLELVTEVLARAVAAVECWITEGITIAMEAFNQPVHGLEQTHQEDQA